MISPSSAISFLFVPASRPDRYEKALASDADVVIIDLEDAVADADKDSSLADLLQALDSGLPRPVVVRVNSPDSQWFERDLQALSHQTNVAGVVIPKVGSATQVTAAVAVLPNGCPVIPTIESVAGLAAVADIAAVPGVVRFAVGAADLSFDLDAEISSPTMEHIYARLVIDSKLAGVAGPVASPPFSLRDTEAIEQEARRLRGLGVTAQLCIHPAQVPAIRAGFLPTSDQVEWARSIVEATNDADGASAIDGHMVDQPIRDRALRILTQVGHDVRK